MINLDHRWLKASVIGSIWGSFEIIMGSFLHNLKIPFAGSIMAFFSILLMIAFLQRWKEKGIIWRAGLIAALMKSLSPSAFLLGPMTGIFLEAVLIEIFISLIGVNFFSCLLAGGFSLLSALGHKLFNLYILYGSDFILIYKKIISFAFEGFSHVGTTLLVVVGVFYFLSGVVAAFLGYVAGRNIVRSGIGGESTITSPQQEKPLPTGNRSIVMLVSHLVIIPLLMFLNSRFEWYLSLMVVTLYISYLGILYPVVLHRLRKPMLWLQLLFMLLLSVLFLGSYSPESGFSLSGLLAGVKMNLRALIVIAGFAAIGYELRNEKIKVLIVAYANPSFYQSIKISFGLLPGIMSYMNSPASILRHPLRNLKMMLNHAEIHFNQLLHENDSKYGRKV